MGDRQQTHGWNFEFSDCKRGGSRYNGEFETRDYGNYEYTSTGLTIDSENTTTAFSGWLAYKLRSNRDGGPDRHYKLLDVNYQMTQSGRETALMNATFKYGYVNGLSAALNGRFSLQSTATGGVLVNVSTADPLIAEIPPLYYFQSGLMVVDAGSNNTLLIDPSNGDENTFNVTLNRPDHQAVTQIERWEDWGEYLDFNFDLYQDSQD